MNPLGLDPVIFHLGPLQVRWYGLMYVIGFLLAGKIWTKLSESGFFKLSKEHVDKFLTLLIIGLFIGSRVLYVFVYNWDYYSEHLLEFFSVWKGGLSFHGALIGIIVTSWLLTRKYKLHFFEFTDSLTLIGTPGLFFGRLGNFINGELYGRVTDVPWGIVFPTGGPYPRHPSQLYEAILEGFILFIILWIAHKKVKIHGILSGIFIFGYGLFRYIVEFFREADAQLGYYFGGTTTMGQILCILMMLGGIFIFFLAKKQQIPVQKNIA